MRSPSDRKLKCYDLLLEQANRGMVITYGDFALALDVAPVGLGFYLRPILNWCRRSNRPELPIIVVSTATRKPRGPYEEFMIVPETARVFAFEWSGIERPSLWDLHEPR